MRREIAGETFLVPIRGRVAELQELFIISEVGSWIWDRLDVPKRLEDLATEVVAEFEVSEQQAHNDVRLFVQQLTEAGLVETVDAEEA